LLVDVLVERATFGEWRAGTNSSVCFKGDGVKSALFIGDFCNSLEDERRAAMGDCVASVSSFEDRGMTSNENGDPRSKSANEISFTTGDASAIG
jgi:hypothetical protein